MSQKRTVYRVPKMDCPSEEKLIRMALANENKISLLQFDLSGRKLTAFHETDEVGILKKLEPLNFGAVHEETKTLTELEENLLQLERAKASWQEKGEAKVLWVLLAINSFMFIFELAWGLPESPKVTSFLRDQIF